MIDELEHPFFAIPGDHDLISRGSGESLRLAEFERRYTPGKLPYHERIGGIDLLALNSNRSTRGSVADSSEGQLQPETVAWLEEKLETVDRPLVVVHHARPGTRSLLMDTMDRLPASGESPGFGNADHLLATLATGNAPLVLTGLLPVPPLVSRSGVCEFSIPSVGLYPRADTVLEIDGSDDGATPLGCGLRRPGEGVRPRDRPRPGPAVRRIARRATALRGVHTVTWPCFNRSGGPVR